MYPASTTQLGIKLAIAQGTTAQGDNCTSQQFHVRFKREKKTKFVFSVSTTQPVTMLALILVTIAQAQLSQETTVHNLAI